MGSSFARSAWNRFSPFFRERVLFNCGIFTSGMLYANSVCGECHAHRGVPLKLESNERIVVLGASRGLGKALSQTLAVEVENLLLLSRRASLLQDLQASLSSDCVAKVMALDFANHQDQIKTQEIIQSFQPTRIIYCAGGGPYGEYHNKDWKDHRWCFEVTFGMPAFLTQFALNMDSVKQITLIGSSIAENSEDKNAASYSAAKHALLGLHKTVSQESHGKDFRLYSPSYMDTDLLPPNAKARKDHPLSSPEDVASDLLQWIQDERNLSGHRVMN